MFIPSHGPMGLWDIPWDVHLSLSLMHGTIGHSTGCPPDPLVGACVCPTVHLIPGCLPVPLTEARVSYCPFHPTIQWDHGTFHWMSTCPSHRSACTLLSIPSHGTMGHSTGCPPVPLTDACVSHCPSHPTIPWDHWTFHGMSTCPSHRCICVPLSIPFYDPMGSWDIPWDVHLSLSQMHVYPPVHPIPRSHGTMGHSIGCPPVPLIEAHVPSVHPIPWDHGTFHGMSTCPSHRYMCVPLSIPFHDPMGSWDIPWDVHLSLSQMHVYSPVHPIPRSNGTMGRCYRLTVTRTISLNAGLPRTWQF